MLEDVALPFAQLSPLPFKTANLAAMEKKIQELNDTVKAANGSAALRPEESANLTEIFGALSTNNTTSLTAQHVTLVSSVIERWPPAQAFPGRLIPS